MARAKKAINRDSFCRLYSWMAVDLGLSGNDLMVYAFIYAYSTNEGGKGCYFGGNEVISRSLGCTTKSVERSVHKLNDMGLIELKQAELENGLKLNCHRVSPEALEPLEDLSSSVAEGLKAIRAFSESWEDLTKMGGKVKRAHKVRGEAERLF